MHAALAPLYDFRLSSTGALLAIVYGVMIGGAIGSFLNVVAYRLPLGMNLSRPGSRCPKCERPIRPWHNIPVLGWLLLRGRCRDCGQPISVRYPIVEFLVAAASGIVVWKSLTPAFEDDIPAYSINVIAVILRLSLVFLCSCSALLEFDGNRLPWRMNLATVLGMTVGALLIAELRPPQPLTEQLPPISALAFPAAGSVILGLISWPLLLLPPSPGVTGAVARFGLLCLAGIVLGGMALLFVVPAAAGLVLAVLLIHSGWPTARRFGWAAALVAATLVWFLIAGPDLGSNDTVVVGDMILLPDSPWHVLNDVGLLTAALALVGRLAYWLSVRTTTHSTS